MRGNLSALLAAGISLSGAVLGSAVPLEVPDAIDGFIGPIEYGNATINAPLDENGKETYMGFKFFPEAYIPHLCAAHCISTTNYNKKHPGPNGEYMTCVS